MGAREVYQAACKAAEVARLATIQAATLSAQETINAQGVGMGSNHNPALGVADGSALDTATRNANASYVATRFKAEHDKQIAINNARSVLQQTDTAPA